MKIIVGLVCFFLMVGNAFATEYDITSKYFDLTPGDGFMDAGTQTNPYVIESDGESFAEIRPKFFDLTPHDGFMDVGTPQNPYVIETQD